MKKQKTPYPSPSRQRGIALILVLTMMTVLVSLAANYVLSVARDTESIDLLNTRIQARYSAYSGIQYALFAMQDSDKAVRWTTDGKVYSVPLAGGEIFVKMQPESGRLDINSASPQLLTLLFQYAGLEAADATKVMNNVMHWRNGKDAAVGDSVTDADYEAENLPIPAHRRFYAIEELAQVYGVTPSMYLRIKPLITVYGSNKINGLVASDDLLTALELEPNAIETIHQAREAYYTDETPIPATLLGVSPYVVFNVRSAYYRAMAYATTVSGQTEAVYSIIKNQRNRNGSYREMERGTVNGADRKALIQAVQQAIQRAAEAE